MKLEDQVTNLEISKQLKELGVKQESYFVWLNNNSKDPSQNWFCRSIFTGLQNDKNLFGWGGQEMVSAFTVAELGEMLPSGFATRRSDLTSLKSERFKVYNQPGENYHHEFADTEANARGKMLIYLLENKLTSTP